MTPVAFISTCIDRVIGVILLVLFLFFSLAMLYGYGKDATDDFKAWRLRRKSQRQTTKGLATKPQSRVAIRKQR